MLSRNIVTCDDTTTVKRGYSYSTAFFIPGNYFVKITGCSRNWIKTEKFDSRKLEGNNMFLCSVLNRII